MLEAKSLRKATIPPSLLPDPSPGNLQATRLALHVNEGGSSCSIYIASGCRVYRIEISMEDFIISKGKESLLIPVHAQVINSLIVDRCPHRSEIQSVVLAEGDGDNCLVLGTVDSYGHLIVSRMDVIDAGFHIRYFPVILVLVKGAGLGSASVQLTGQRQQLLGACAEVLMFMIKISIFAVFARSQLSIWDLRTNHNGGCIRRVSGSIGDVIYTVSSLPSGEIAVGGSDRTVTIYDPRRWSALSRWVNCSKYEITGLSFSSVDPAYIYVQGVDYEVMCGQWKENEKAFSFRGDSNWLGFSKCANKDVLAGWCESGSIFVADVVQ